MRRLIECVPNFSQGRDPARVDELVASMSGVPGACVIDRQSDFDHNRSVITLAGEPQAVAAAALRGVAKAAGLIDMTRHAGVHPRVGATDVLPFVPLAGVTLDECAELAWSVGREIWQRYHIPVYFYEAAALRPQCKNLEEIRRGQFEGLCEAAPRDPARAPDIGGPQLHPTAGAVIVGARKPLIALNVNLSTPDATIAKAIARAIRFSSGGLRHVKAIGVELKTRGRAQVSINLTDFEHTPLHRVFELVRIEAERRGCAIVETEIVGLASRKALEMAAAYFLRVDESRPPMTIEDRVATALDAETTDCISTRGTIP